MNNVKRVMDGTSVHPNCDVHAQDQPGNAGCTAKDNRSQSYGTGFNQNGGGVYALRWTKADGIQIYFFPRNAIPADIKSGATPTPEKWGNPVADYPFGNNCNAANFNTMKVVINLTFCGDWAGQASSYSGCPGDCKSYVQDTPRAFDQAYWDINSLKVYQQ